MTNAELIAEARRLADAATPGPWLLDDSRPHTVMASDGSYVGGILYNSNTPDVEFVASSRTLVPQLADALAAALEENAALLARKCVHDLAKEYSESTMVHYAPERPSV